LDHEQGLALLAINTHAKQGTPVARTLLAGASLMLRKAQSGEPSERAEGERLVALQNGSVLPSAVDAVRALVPNESVYYAGEPARLIRASNTSVGSLILSTHYLFFIEGTDESDAIEREFDPERRAQLEERLLHANSLAVPLRQVSRLRMLKDPLLSLELTWSTNEDSSQPESAILEVGSGKPEEIAARVGLWMCRLQLACTAEGNLLCWEEDQPLVIRPA
jgi:hypothetical protein